MIRHTPISRSMDDEPIGSKRPVEYMGSPLRAES